jgi:hypothetical protein
VCVPGTRFDDEKKLAYLDIDVDEGKQFYVSSVRFLDGDEKLFQSLLPLKSGDIYNQRLVNLFFKEHASLLPAGASASSNVHLQLDQQARTVAVTFDFRQLSGPLIGRPSVAKMFLMVSGFIVAVTAIAVVLGIVIAGICLGHPYIYDPL